MNDIVIRARDVREGDRLLTGGIYARVDGVTDHTHRATGATVTVSLALGGPLLSYDPAEAVTVRRAA